MEYIPIKSYKEPKIKKCEFKFLHLGPTLQNGSSGVEDIWRRTSIPPFFQMRQLSNSLELKSNNGRRKGSQENPFQNFLQVTVWGGISSRGKTSLAIVNGTIDARKYCDILEEHLLEFANNFPDGWQFQQDKSTFLLPLRIWWIQLKKFFLKIWVFLVSPNLWDLWDPENTNYFAQKCFFENLGTPEPPKKHQFRCMSISRSKINFFVKFKRLNAIAWTPPYAWTMNRPMSYLLYGYMGTIRGPLGVFKSVFLDFGHQKLPYHHLISTDSSSLSKIT